MGDIAGQPPCGVALADVEKAGKSPLPHDSMVTVRLSEPPELHVVQPGAKAADPDNKGPSPPELELQSNMKLDSYTRDSMDDTDADTIYERSKPIMENTTSPVDSERRRSDSSSDSVNWEGLEETEDQEPRDQATEDSTALLLARLEQENNLLVTNPKSGLAKAKTHKPPRRQTRPPSMHQLKQMVNGPPPPSLRYSLIQAPPMTDLEFYAALVQDYKRTAHRLPTLLSKKIRAGIPPPLRGVVWQSMSGARDLQLEEEYDRLCGESSPYTEIIGKDLGRSFPGVEMFSDPEGDGQRMLGKVLRCFSLYDHKIGYCQGLGFLVGPLLMHMPDKQAFCVLVRLMENYDLRSCYLPDLSGLHVRIYQFRELLKRHLPTLSAHLDLLQLEPAYVSQWFLSFFAVTCPLPMLFRIYDVIFAEGASETMMRVALSLMRKNEEKILACTEFEDVMQLLLSRGLWDCYHMDADEFVGDFVSLTGIVTHEVLQALEQSCKDIQESGKTPVHASDIASAGSRFLGRIWNSKSSTSLSPGALAPKRAGSGGGGGFLRRSASKQSMASTLGSSEGGGSASTDSMMSAATTEASRKSSSHSDTASVRVPSTVFSSVAGQQKSLAVNNKNLNGQIEDLLLALNEMQREQAQLVTQLQREREEREEDRHVVGSLVDVIRKSSVDAGLGVSRGSLETVMPFVDVEVLEKKDEKDEKEKDEKDDKKDEKEEKEEKEKEKEKETRHDSPMEATAEEAKLAAPPTAPELAHPTHSPTAESPKGTPAHLSLNTPRNPPISSTTLPSDTAFYALLRAVETRFSRPHDRHSMPLQSKAQLRADLAQAREQLAASHSKSADLGRRLSDAEQALGALREQIRDGYSHIRNGLQEKNRLERLVQELRARLPAGEAAAGGEEGAQDWRRGSVHSTNGLRELRLGRGNGQGAGVFAKRSSSLQNSVPASPSPSVESHPNNAPMSPTGDSEALILELVQAKTGEAVARQEAEEARAKLESLRRMVGMAGEGGQGKGKEAPQQQQGKETGGGGGGGFWGWGKRSASLVEMPGK